MSKHPKIFDFYSDPGHGWLKVKLRLLERLGLISKISFCSKINKGYAFLEEDDDAKIFIKAYREAFGEDVKRFRCHNADKRSKIRGYWSFKEQVVLPMLETYP